MSRACESATALLGFLTSIALLHLHLYNLELWYPISVAIAYAGFLGFVRLWILYQQRTWQWVGATRYQTNAARAPTQPKQKNSSERFSWLDWLDLLDIFDDFVVMALLIAGAISIFFVIWHVINLVAVGEDFLAELLLDGVFGAALDRVVVAILLVRTQAVGDPRPGSVFE